MQQFVTSLGIFLKGGVDRTPSLRARDWNEKIVAPTRRLPILPGAAVRATRTSTGQIVNIDPNYGWRHPWFVSGYWRAGVFHVSVHPGFVNGLDPIVPGLGDLTTGPEIPIPSWRPLPQEADPLPAFFRQFGVSAKLPGSNISIRPTGGVTVTEETENPRRIVMAADIWLATARATYRGTTTITDASGTTGEVVDYSVSFDTSSLDRVGARPRLLAGPQMPAVRQPTLYERLSGVYQDEGEDRIRIATIYMLSPDNVLAGPPNATWQFFKANNVFWNLSHAARNALPPKPYPPIRLFTGLAGGWLDLIGNQFLSQVNEASERVRNAVNTTTNEGRYWQS